MEALGILEKKIVALVDVIKQLKAENSELAESLEKSRLEVDRFHVLVTELRMENESLSEKLEQVEHSILLSNERAEALDQEKELTKMVVKDLLDSISTLVPNEDHQS